MKKKSNIHKETNIQYDVNKAWNISLKYSKLILNKINNIHKKYIIELKFNKINVSQNKIYIYQWNNLAYTFNKNYLKKYEKNKRNIIECIYNLHYTSLLRN